MILIRREKHFYEYQICSNYSVTTYSDCYTEKEKQLFERRLELRINADDIKMKESFLAMYANPVVNKSKYENAI